MARIVIAHHADKEDILKGNVEVDPKEVMMVFDRIPNYAEVLEKLRIELKWSEPSDVVELDGMHNVLFGIHICWKTMPLNLE
jgi:hypothetical protein